MPQVIGPVDHGSTLDVAIVARTAQVFAYRLWIRHGASPWQVLGEGSTASEAPHAFSMAVADGLQVYHWVGVGGHPDAPFECVVVFTQGDAVVAHGSISVTGQLDSSGVAAAQDWVNVR